MKSKIIYLISFISILITFAKPQTDFDAAGLPILSAKNKTCGRIEEIPGDPRTKVPWAATIFHKDNSAGFRFLVGGTIISKTAIITVLGGTYGSPPRGAKGRYFIFKPSNIFIGVGMKSTHIKDSDEYTQFLRVKYIEPHKNHSSINKEYHVFIFHLETEIKYDQRVREVCTLDKEVAQVFYDLYEVQLYDYDLSLHADITNVYFIGGYTNTYNKNRQGKRGKDQLQAHNVVAENKKFCDNAYNYYYKAYANGSEVFCGKLYFRGEEFDNDTCIQYGSTVFMTSDDQKFMTGMTALTPNKRRGLCNKNSLYFIAGTWHYINFIYRSLKCSPNHGCSDGTCVPTNKLCDNVNDCSDGSDEDSIFCQATNYCSKGYVPCHYNGKCIRDEYTCPGQRNCHNGEPNLDQICDRRSFTSLSSQSRSLDITCDAPVQSEGEGVILTCEDPNGQEIDCSKAPLGSQAVFKCAEYYISRFRFSTLRMKCSENGLWKTFRSFACEPDCGIIYNVITPYIAHGLETTRKSAFPWYGAIFTRPDSNSDFKYACGSSLIEKSVIITSAHCVTDKFGIPLSLNKLRVILAPGSSDYLTNERDFSSVSQIFAVKEIWIPKTYDRRTLTSDIAIVQLSEASKFGSFVRPICYLVKNTPNIFKAGAFAKVAGFGSDEKNEPSQTLKYLDVPIIRKDECNRNRNLPYKTFCVGWKNGSSLCSGDSGSGLAFPLKKAGGNLARYTLMGVASLSTDDQNCSQTNYNVFTDLELYSDWIIDILEKIETIII